MKNLECKILLQIHDELIFEVKNGEAKKYSKIIQDEMSSVKDSDLHSFSIPLLVDVNVGDNWGDLH
jgi:DNA polymerase-1